MKIYLDDERTTPEGYVRTYNVFQTIALVLTAMRNFQTIEHISLDHDLGTGETGYDFLLWVEEMVNDGWVPPPISVHSANPVGRKRMEQVIARFPRKN
jgi:hypothetical protein